MKGVNFKKSIVLVLSAIMIFALAACNNSAEQHNKDNMGIAESRWGVQINGKEISLPCTLSDFEKIGVTVYSEFDKENILNSTNETFTMIAATCGENMNPVHIKVVTGDDADKKEENATVKIITNTKMDSTLFNLRNNIALGSSIDDVISTFGEDYVSSRNAEEDIHSGYVVLKYGTTEDGAMFNFQDGILEYIEILADKGE